MIKKKVLILLSKWGGFLRNIFYRFKIYEKFDEIIILSSSKIFLESNLKTNKITNVSFEEKMNIRDNKYKPFLIETLIKIIDSKEHEIFLISFFPFQSNFKDINILQANYNTSKKCESKRYFAEIMKNSNVSSKNYVQCYDDVYCKNFEKISSCLDIPFVVQYDSCGGKGTYFVKDKFDWESIELYNIDKISRYIDGTTFNFNVLNILIQNEINVFIELPSMKPMNIKELHGINFSSCGNEWGNHSILNIERIINEIEKIGKYIYRQYEFLGVWGVDCIVNNDTKTTKIIEINARLQGTTEVSSAIQLLRKFIPFPYLQISSYLDKKITNLNSSKYNQETIMLNKNCSFSAFYIKIKGKSDFVFNPSKDFKGDGIYKIKDNKLVFYNNSIQTIEANLDEGLILLVNTPLKGTKIKLNNEICMIESVKSPENIIFLNDNTLSHFGQKIVSLTYKLLRMK